MPEPTDPNEPNSDPTAGYKPEPKGANFGLVVALSCVAFLILLILAVLLVHSKGTRMAPHPPNPTPNALVQPATVAHRLLPSNA